MSDCECHKIGYEYSEPRPSDYREGMCSPCSGGDPPPGVASCCVWQEVLSSCESCATGASGDCPHRLGAQTGYYYYGGKPVSLGRISITDKSGFKHVMSSDLPDSSLDYNTYELMAEVNYYTRPNKYCNEYQSIPGKNAFNESFRPETDSKHTGVYEKEPTLIFYLERRPRRGGFNSAVTASNRSGYFLAVDESGDFVLVGTGAANGEVTSGSSKVSFDDITGSFPKIAYDGSSDSDLNNYDLGDDECDVPRPILKFGTGEPITGRMFDANDWRYISGQSCEDGPYNSDTIWTNTSVFSGFDSYVKSKLTAGARLADLTDVFGADHTVDETTIPGYHVCHSGNLTDGVQLIYSGTGENHYDEPGIGDENEFSGTGAFHYLSAGDQTSRATTPYYSKLVTKAGDSDFYYIGSKYIHNDWTVSMQGCMDLPESQVDFEKITEIYGSGTTIYGPSLGAANSWGHSFPRSPAEPLATEGYYSLGARPHFEPHLNDAYREAAGETLPDPSLCQKIKNLYSGRKLELDSSLTGKMVDLFVRAYKDQYPGDFTGSRTTGDLIQWLTDPSSFYGVSLSDYENSRCCSGTGTISEYNGVNCNNSIINGAYVTSSGTGCVERGSKSVLYNDCTGVMRATVSGGMYWTGGYAPSDPQQQYWSYNYEIFNQFKDILGKATGDNQNITSALLTGSGILEHPNFIKTTIENNYSGIFRWTLFSPTDTNFTGYYNLNCPGQSQTENCFNINNTSYRCDTGNNSGYNSTDGFTDDAPSPWGTSGMSYILNMFSVDGSVSGCCGCAAVGPTGPTGPTGDTGGGGGDGCVSGEPDAVFTGTGFGGYDFCLKYYKRTGVDLADIGYAGTFNDADMYIQSCDTCYNTGYDGLPPNGCKYIILESGLTFGSPYLQWIQYTKGSLLSKGAPTAFGPSDFTWTGGQPSLEPTGDYTAFLSTVGTLSYDTGASICSS